jgi:hypothetical protein
MEEQAITEVDADLDADETVDFEAGDAKKSIDPICLP